MAATESVRADVPASQGLGARLACRGSGHSLRVVGYLHGPAGRRALRLSALRPVSECRNPLLRVCDGCDYAETWPCNSHRESRCEPCSLRYRRRLRRLAEVGMDKRAGHGFMGMLTLTAPGDSPHREWVPTQLHRPGMDRPDCHCHEGVELGEWNAGHSASWNRLRTALAKRHPEMEYLRGVEVQGRGALHDHVILWSPNPVDIAEVQALALAAGYGCVMDWAPCEPGSRKAAYYVSKYVTKSCDARSQVPWLRVDRATGEVLATAPTFRTWSSSQGWGMTMSEIRALCREQVQKSLERKEKALLDYLGDALGAVVTAPHDP